MVIRVDKNIRVYNCIIKNTYISNYKDEGSLLVKKRCQGVFEINSPMLFDLKCKSF